MKGIVLTPEFAEHCKPSVCVCDEFGDSQILFNTLYTVDRKKERKNPSRMSLLVVM